MNPSVPAPLLPLPLHSAAKWLDANPFSSLFLPPVLFLIQFFLLLLLIGLGFPEHAVQVKVQVSLVLSALFGLSFLCLFGMALGVRQAFRLESKALPIIGALANLAYMAGFSGFFLFVLVLQNLT